MCQTCQDVDLTNSTVDSRLSATILTTTSPLLAEFQHSRFAKTLHMVGTTDCKVRVPIPLEDGDFRSSTLKSHDTR